MLISQKIDFLVSQIKQQPMNLDLRLSLVQYFCLNSDWSKALNCIEQYLKLHPQDRQSSVLLKQNILCEIKRETLLKEYNIELVQSILPDCKIVRQQVELLNNYLQQVEPAQLEQQFLEYIQSQSLRTVSINQQPYKEQLILDSDLRYAMICEIFIGEQYCWLAWQDISKIYFKSNQYLTDLLWRRAEIILNNGNHLAGFIPVRYPLIEQKDYVDELKYAQKTDWFSYGQLNWADGQKMICHTEHDFAILDIEDLSFLS